MQIVSVKKFANFFSEKSFKMLSDEFFIPACYALMLNQPMKVIYHVPIFNVNTVCVTILRSHLVNQNKVFGNVHNA